jgi:hypothetical protein
MDGGGHWNGNERAPSPRSVPPMNVAMMVSPGPILTVCFIAMPRTTALATPTPGAR